MGFWWFSGGLDYVNCLEVQQILQIVESLWDENHQQRNMFVTRLVVGTLDSSFQVLGETDLQILGFLMAQVADVMMRVTPRRLAGAILASPALAGYVDLYQPIDFSYLECWELSVKKEAKVFHLHIPKVAGCSLVQDLSKMVGREEVFSEEVCFSFASTGHYENTVVMLRFPRDHVYSMYEFCHMAVDPGYVMMVGMRQGLKGQENYRLASSFSEWINEWYSAPRWGDYDIYEDEEFCYCPYNMQSSRLACYNEYDAKYCYPSADMQLAMTNLQKATMLGVVEAYHESICLFSVRILGSLPEHCDCEGPLWDSYVETDITHRDNRSEPIGSINDMPTETIEKVDEMTRDDLSLYKAGMERFIHDIREVEERFGKNILCDAQLLKLQQKTSGSSKVKLSQGTIMKEWRLRPIYGAKLKGTSSILYIFHVVSPNRFFFKQVCRDWLDSRYEPCVTCVQVCKPVNV